MCERELYHSKWSGPRKSHEKHVLVTTNMCQHYIWSSLQVAPLKPAPSCNKVIAELHCLCFSQMFMASRYQEKLCTTSLRFQLAYIPSGQWSVKGHSAAPCHRSLSLRPLEQIRWIIALNSTRLPHHGQVKAHNIQKLFFTTWNEGTILSRKNMQVEKPSQKTALNLLNAYFHTHTTPWPW